MQCLWRPVEISGPLELELDCRELPLGCLNNPGSLQEPVLLSTELNLQHQTWPFEHKLFSNSHRKSLLKWGRHLGKPTKTEGEAEARWAPQRDALWRDAGTAYHLRVHSLSGLHKWQLSLLGFYCCDKDWNQKQVGEKGVHLAYISRITIHWWTSR